MSTAYGLFTLADPDSDPYSDSDSCTMQEFHIDSDSDSDWNVSSRDGDLSLKWVQ